MSANEITAANFLKGQIQQDFLNNVGAVPNTPVNPTSQQQIGSCIGVFSCIAVSGVGTPNNPANQEEQIIQNIVANTQPQDLIHAIAQLPEALQVRVVTAYPRHSLAQALELSQANFGKLPESTQLVIAGLVKAEAAQVGSCIGVFSCIAVTGAGQASPPPPAPPQQVGSCIGIFSCIAVSGAGQASPPPPEPSQQVGSCIGIFSCIAVSGAGTAVPPNLSAQPRDIQFQIMNNLSPQDLLNLSQTSRDLQPSVFAYVQSLVNNQSLVYTATFQGGRMNGWSVRGTNAHQNNPQEVLRLWVSGQITKQQPQQVGSCIGIFSCIAASGVGAGNNVAPTEEQTIENIVANTQPQNFISAIAQLPEHLQVKVVKEYPPQSLAQALESSQAEFGQLPEATQLVIAGLVQASLKQVGSCVGLFSCIAVSGVGQTPTPPSPQVGSCIGIFSCIAVSGVGTAVPPNLQTLPKNMQIEILKNLPPTELSRLSQTSSYFDNLVRDYLLDHLYLPHNQMSARTAAQQLRNEPTIKDLLDYLQLGMFRRR